MKLKMRKDMLKLNDEGLHYIRKNQVIASAPLYECILFYHEASEDGYYHLGIHIPGYDQLIEFICDLEQKKEYKKIVHEMKGTCALIEVNKELAAAFLENKIKDTKNQELSGWMSKEETMFLRTLSEEDKLKYLELARLVADIDGTSGDKEKEMIHQAMGEMQVHQMPPVQLSIDELIKHFANKSSEIKKAVLFELYSLVVCDEKMADEEKAVMKNIISAFDINKKKAKEIKQLAVDLQKQYDLILDALL